MTISMSEQAYADLCQDEERQHPNPDDALDVVYQQPQWLAQGYWREIELRVRRSDQEYYTRVGAILPAMQRVLWQILPLSRHDEANVSRRESVGSGGVAAGAGGRNSKRAAATGHFEAGAARSHLSCQRNFVAAFGQSAHVDGVGAASRTK